MSLRPLSPELQERAIAELNEDPARVQEDIRHIKEWLKKQPHLTPRKDDQMILTYLRGCKFSLERTKEKLDMYYTMKTLLPEFYKNRDPLNPEIQEVLSRGILLPLPVLTPSGQRVMMHRAAMFDPTKTDLATVAKTNLLISDILVKEDDNYVICGEYVIIDLHGANSGHLGKLQPSQIKKSNKLYEKAYPSRPKGFYYLNIPSFFEMVNKMIEPFLSEKMKSRTKVIHKDDMEELYKVVPRSCLPKEYGGEAGTIAEIAAEWKKKVESYRDWFLEDEKYCSNEKKRPGKPKTSDELFGLEGSFRQLSVD